MQQGVVQRFAAVFGSLDKDAEVLHHLVLSGKVCEVERTQRLLEVRRPLSDSPRGGER